MAATRSAKQRPTDPCWSRVDLAVRAPMLHGHVWDHGESSVHRAYAVGALAPRLLKGREASPA